MGIKDIYEQEGLTACMDIESVLPLALNEEVCVQHFALLICKSSSIVELLSRSTAAQNELLLSTALRFYKNKDNLMTK